MTGGPDRRLPARFAAGLASHPRLAALACGLVGATGFPPLGLWPLTLLATAVLAWLVWQSAGWRRAAWIGWLFGVAHFTLANNWIATAFTHQAKMPAVLGWAAVPLLSLYLALYPALAAGAARALSRGRSLTVFAPIFGATWIAGEWLKSWVFTGYPWPPLSLSLLGPFTRPGAALLLPLTGTYALSGLLVTAVTLLLAGMLARRWAAAGAGAAAILAAMLWPAPARTQGTLPFTLVQPNLQQEELNDPTKYEEQFARLAALTRPRRDTERRLVLWPESALPDYLESGYPQRYYDQLTARGDPEFARGRVGAAAGDGGLVLAGVVNLRIADEGGYPRAVAAYNSVVAIDQEGEFRGRYDKSHLVPYGEYLPMRGLLGPLGMARLVAGTLDFIPGPGPRTVNLGPWGQAGIQICYEIVFSGQVVDPAVRPDYIFNPSNDGWFGAWGPPQHLAQARMRAIEEGLPVLRSTTTGISAVVDAHGVVRASIERDRADRIDGVVPPALAPTPFARMGHGLTLMWGLILVAAWLVVRRREPR
ncbi:apolipoprotein N-acyltransferase [Qipengyuania sp.]|uniref:apolipoprotein N-acyltransferase n=1 Tax=Qipengyuania sp. TaxID=2004515 RepID=UPI0035C864D0